MIKWVLLTLLFLIVLTGTVLSIDSSRDKVISITNQSLRVVNSREFLNSDVKIENTKLEPKDKIIEINTTETEAKNSKKELSNEDLINLKFNQLLNKKTEVQSIWDNKKTTKTNINNKKFEQNSTKITNSKNEITQQIQNAKQITKITQPSVKFELSKPITTKTTNSTAQNKTTTAPTAIQTTENFAKLPKQVVIAKPMQKVQKIDFSSPSFQEKLRIYITQNVNFHPNYIVHFSFLYSQKGDIAEIHIISIPEKDYHDGNDTYISHIYGDVCKRDNLANNEMYYNNDSSVSNLIAIPINSTPDGQYIKLFYDSLKNLSSSHTIKQISYEEIDNYTSIGGMYYQGNLYLYTN